MLSLTLRGLDRGAARRLVDPADPVEPDIYVAAYLFPRISQPPVVIVWWDYLRYPGDTGASITLHLPLDESHFRGSVTWTELIHRDEIGADVDPETWRTDFESGVVERTGDGYDLPVGLTPLLLAPE